MNEKADTRFMSGEDALEVIQAELKEEIDMLFFELGEKIMVISKDREGYDLTEFAMEYVKGLL